MNNLSLVPEMAHWPAIPCTSRGDSSLSTRDCRFIVLSDDDAHDFFVTLVHRDGKVADTLPAAIRLRRSLYINRFLKMEATADEEHPRQLYSIEHKLAKVPSIMIDAVVEASRIIEFLEPEEREALKAAAQAVLDRAEFPLPDI